METATPITEADYAHLGTLVEDDHHGALEEPDTCDVDAACAAGLFLLAAHLLANAADVSPELETELKRLFDAQRLEREQAEFATMPRYRCPTCTATVNCWDDDHTRCHGCHNEPPPQVLARAFHESALRASTDSGGYHGEPCVCGASTRLLASPRCAALAEADEEQVLGYLGCEEALD